MQGGSSAAGRQAGAVHPLPGQCSCSQPHLALEGQGLLPHANRQTEREKMPQRGARIQVSSVQTTPAQAETHWIQEKCPSQLLHAKQELQAPMEVRPCSAPPYRSVRSPGLELSSHFALTILYELPTAFSASG